VVRIRALVVVILAAAAAAVHVPASSPAPPGYRTLFAGNPPTGGHWDFSAKRRTIAGRRALCLSFTTRSREGVEFSSVGCAAGTLRAWNNVFPIASGYGGNLDANLVGGFTVARARFAVVTFADGKRITTVTRLGPPAFRRALGGPIRFIVVNAFLRTRAAARSVSVFDARSRRIGRSKLGS
jgi:hypothetical protein